MDEGSMDTMKEKKTWIKPQLIVYGDVEKLTTELPVPIGQPPIGNNSSTYP